MQTDLHVNNCFYKKSSSQKLSNLAANYNKMHHMRLVLLLVIFLVSNEARAFLLNLGAVSDRITLGSFNIQSLGPTKIQKPEVVTAIVKILSMFDVIAIQEIKDSSANAAVINSLVTSLNNAVK